MLVTSSLILLSCCGCVSIVERLTKEDSGCANLLTFSSFLFVSIEGLVRWSKFFTVKNSVPLRAYLKIVVLFFLVNVINNQALGYNIPMTLHIIFRSGSLVTNLLLTRLMLNKVYSWKKYLSVLVITAGIILTTLATFKAEQLNTVEQSNPRMTLTFFIGICMLIFALVFSSVLGIYQEKLYRQYGKHPTEAMFYIHALALPFFAFFYRDIVNHVVVFNQSEKLIGLPKLWLLLAFNCLLQYFCIKFVYQLTAQRSTLTVTFVITVRKFLSLLLSIILFGNQFTTQHWIGTILVFSGSFLFIRRRKGQKERKE